VDNAEEYVLQVFCRAQSVLERDVKPAHGAYLVKLGQKFAHTADLKSEIACLNYIRGFAKAGLTFEWLLGRSQRDREFSRERFEADARLVYEVLIDAFNGEWFDPFAWDEPPQHHSEGEPVPMFSEPNWNYAAAPAAETMTRAAAPVAETMTRAAAPVAETITRAAAPVAETMTRAAAPAAKTMTRAAAPVAETMTRAAAPRVYDTPSFADLLDHPMLVMVRRLTESAAAFDRTSMAERAPSLAVLKMTAKSVVDMARPLNIVVVAETFSEIARLLESIERKGLMNDTACAAIISRLGTMLSDALHATGSGIRSMQEITEFIHVSKETRLK
jgi:hypothetical protein